MFEVLTKDWTLEYVSREPWKRWYGWYAKNVMDHSTFNSLNYGAVQQACDKLGLFSMPEIKVSNGALDINATGVTYGPRYKPAYIHIRGDLKPKVFSVVLWHELRHCKQHQDNNFVPLMYDPLSPIEVYWNRPTEVEAREVEVAGVEHPLSFQDVPLYNHSIPTIMEMN